VSLPAHPFPPETASSLAVFWQLWGALLCSVNSKQLLLSSSPTNKATTTHHPFSPFFQRHLFSGHLPLNYELLFCAYVPDL